MTNETLLTAAIIRRETLEQFAKLTRHSPAALDGKFGLSMRTDYDTVFLRAMFGGKRHAERQFNVEALAWSLDRFSEEIAKPLAKELLESA